MHNGVQFAMLEQLNSISRQNLTHICNADYTFSDFYDYKLLAAVKLLQSRPLTTSLFGKVFLDVGIRKLWAKMKLNKKVITYSKYCHSTLPLGTIKNKVLE